MNLGFLRPLYAGIGGHVSVYLDTTRAVENASEAIALRWRSARKRLTGEGADEVTLQAAEAVVTDPGMAARGRAVFARSGTALFTSPLSHPPRREIARLAPLPHVMPLLAQDPPIAPHLRVAATLAGGEIIAVDAESNGHARDASRRGWPVHKPAAGGWSQPRFHRSAEETWDENAKELAGQVTETAGRIRARLVVIAGDARARSLLLRHLGGALPTTVVVDQEVPADSAVVTEAAEQALADREEQECRDKFELWPSQLSRGAGVEGLADTMAALRDGSVSDLFVVDRPTSTVTAWIGPGGGDLAVVPIELRERGVSHLACDRADAALVRAVAMTGAELHFLPEDLVETSAADGDRGAGMRPRDGVCATLRYATG